MCGWFSAEDARRDGRFVVWRTPDGGQVEITAAMDCDRMDDPMRQPSGEFRGPVTEWLRTEYTSGSQGAVPVGRPRGPGTESYSRLQRLRPERESFSVPTQTRLPFNSPVNYEAALFDDAAQADREAFKRQHADQIIASLSAPLGTSGRAATTAEGTQGTGPAGLRRATYGIDYLASRRASNMWRDFDPLYGAGPGQRRRPTYVVGVLAQAQEHGGNLSPDYRPAAAAVYSLRRAIDALNAAQWAGEGSIRGAQLAVGKARIVEKRVLLALEDLMESKIRPEIDAAQARAVLDDALAVAADATAAIYDTLAANGFVRDSV
nr:hypothetical protein [Pandoravirus massiliensis]